jgi:hypothetical protein
MTHDAAVRPVLRAVLQNVHPGALIVDELGLDYGEARADLAAVNGCLHGYEIKAAADSLARLRDQAKVYGRVLDRATLVVAPNHLAAAKERIPTWWGIWAIEPLGFSVVRWAEENPELDLRCHAALMWRAEAAALLEGVTRKRTPARMTKREIQSALVARLAPDDLRGGVRAALRARGDWRERRQGQELTTARRAASDEGEG